MELAINVIERARRRLVAYRGADRLAADDAFEAHGPHQAGNRAAGHIEALALQLPPDVADPVDPESSPQTRAGPPPLRQRPGCHEQTAVRDRRALRYGRDRSTGRSATPCRSARPHAPGGDRR